MVTFLVDFLNKNMDEENLKNRRLTDEEYSNLSKMLTSSKEDAEIAINCVKAFNMKKSAIQTMFLRKNTMRYSSLWNTITPEIIAYHESLIQELTFNNILKVVEKLPYKEYNLNFYLERFAEFTTLQLRQHFTFINRIDIKLTFKNNEE